jgi:hypothetical protein
LRCTEYHFAAILIATENKTHTDFIEQEKQEREGEREKNFREYLVHFA